MIDKQPFQPGEPAERLREGRKSVGPKIKLDQLGELAEGVGQLGQT